MVRLASPRISKPTQNLSKVSVHEVNKGRSKQTNLGLGCDPLDNFVFGGGEEDAS